MEGKNDHDLIIELTTRLEEFRSANELRMTKLNELREEVTRDREEYVRKDVFETRQTEVASNLRILSDRILYTEHRLAVFVGVGLTIVAVASILGALIGRSFK